MMRFVELREYLAGMFPAEAWECVESVPGGYWLWRVDISVDGSKILYRVEEPDFRLQIGHGADGRFMCVICSPSDRFESHEFKARSVEGLLTKLSLKMGLIVVQLLRPSDDDAES